MLLVCVFFGMIIGMAIYSLITTICEDDGDCVAALEYPMYNVLVFKWFFIYYAEAWIKNTKKRTSLCVDKDVAIEKAQWLARAHLLVGRYEGD
jgi:hypothetical protein